MGIYTYVKGPSGLALAHTCPFGRFGTVPANKNMKSAVLNTVNTLLSRKKMPSRNERSKTTRVIRGKHKLPTRSGTLALSGSASVALL